MFAFRGSPEFSAKLQSALIAAAREDDFRSNKGSHDSGWGGVWYSESEQSFYRTVTPIFEDLKAHNFFEKNQKSDIDSTVEGLSHARLKAEGEPLRGPYDSHPFEAHFGEELVYVSHNGHIDKYKLEDRVGVKVVELNDTEVFTLLLEKVEGSSTKERLENAIEYLHAAGAMIGAVNLMVLSVSHRGTKSIYYHCDYLDETKELYYNLYLLKDQGNSAVMSSTVALKLGLIDLKGKILDPKATLVPRNQVLVL